MGVNNLTTRLQNCSLIKENINVRLEKFQMTFKILLWIKDKFLQSFK